MGIAEMGYQTLISPSHDPTSKKQGANGEMEEAAGKARDESMRSRANKPPWALCFLLTAGAQPPRDLCYWNKLPKILIIPNENCACCAHTVLEAREPDASKIDKIPAL